jgi:hypothetical protein
LIPDTAQLFIVGHTHQPLIRSLGSTLVINTGSVGLPFDGDTRGAYAQIIFQDQTWNANIIRVPYDLEAAVRDFQLTNFIPEGGPIADLVLVELELGWPQLGRFFKKYESAVRNKSISVEDAVYEFLKNPNIENRNLHLPR